MVIVRSQAQRDVLRLRWIAAHPMRFVRNAYRRRVPSDTGYSLHQFDRTGSLFVHIPKACGISVAQSLYGSLAAGHRPIRDYEIVYPAGRFDRLFKFTFVRNPWSRLHSAFRFLQQGGLSRSGNDNQWVIDHREALADFETFVLDHLDRKGIRGYFHFQPQTQLLRSRFGDYYPLDHVGFFENVGADFVHVASRVHPGARLGHDNRTGGEAVDYRAAYTDAMIEKVAQFYVDDIAMLGYDFAGNALADQIAMRAAGTLPIQLKREGTAA